MLNAILNLIDTRSGESGYASPAAWFRDFLVGGESSSGIAVTARTALTYAAVYHAVDLIGDYVGKIPLVLYRRTGDDDREPDKAHPAYRLMRFRPHPLIPAMAFRKTMMGHVLLHGSAYALIRRDAYGDPYELMPLPPTFTHPEIRNGVLWYVTHFDGTPRDLFPEDVLHIRGLPKNGIECYSVIACARDSIGLGLAARTYGAKYFKNAGVPKLSLEHPGRLSLEAKKTIQQTWMDLQAGLDNAHKPAVLEEGMKVNAFPLSMEDAQYLETRQFEIREIANWFKLPSHLLGDQTKTSYASLEQENQSLLDNCLDPWMCVWEEECREKLLTEKEKEADSYFFEFKRQALVRANMKDRYAALRISVGRPWMTPNEARRLENMPADPDGDELLAPLNMGSPGGDPALAADDLPAVDPAGKGRGKNPDPSLTPLPSSLAPLLLDAARRAVKRLGVHARRAARKPERFLEWVDSLRSEHGRSIVEILAAPCAAARTGPKQPTAKDLADRLLIDFSELLLDLAGKATAAELAAKVDAGTADWEALAPRAIAREFEEAALKS